MCEGIISERTYFRYLISSSKISYSSFERLLARLNIDLSQFITYAVFVRSENSVIKFLNRVHTQTFFDIEPLYQQVLNVQSEDILYTRVIKAYIKKYEYLIRKIEKEEYIAELEAIIDTFEKNAPLSVYHIAIYVLYIEINNAVSKELINKVVDNILTLDHTMSFFIYLCSLDTLIYTIIDKNIKRELVERFSQMVNFVAFKTFSLKNYLYTAFLNYMDQDQEAMYKNLLHYAINLAVIYGGEQLHKGKEKFQSLFGFNFDEFIVNESKRVLKSDLFNLINS